MAIEQVGRTILPVPIAAGAALSLKNHQGVTFVCTGADTFTVTSSATFGGAYASPGNIITRKQTCTATNGTAVLVEATQAAGNAVTIAAGAVMFYVDANDLPAGNAYVKCTQGAAGLVQAILGDPLVQRDPGNLVAPGA